MSDFNKLLTESIRLALLQALEQDPGYSHNENILQMILASVGHDVSADRVRTELRWLEEQGLLAITTVGELLIAKVTQRGVDVALGRSRVDGIGRVRP